jgi:hypothetical protein
VQFLYSPSCIVGAFSEDEMRRPTLNAVPYGLQALYGLSIVAQRKEDRPMDDGSKEQPKMTAGLDLGDKYSYLCLIDTERAARLWRRVGCAQPLRPSGGASSQSSNHCA